MKGTIFEKLISISSPIWSAGLVFHTPATTPAKEHNKKKNLPAFVGENLLLSRKDEDDNHKDEKSKSGLIANGEENKLVRSTKCKPDKFAAATVMHDQVQSFASVQSEKFPPGGKEAIIFYTTSLRGIRKTFEDCNKIRFLLDSFRVVYYERDVSMHLEYRDELWGMLGGRVVPPRVFVRGRYVGGADEVVTLHEKGMLRDLLEGIPVSPSTCPCSGCAGVRFVVCLRCNGSRKVMMVEEQENDAPVKCLDCNENGLVKCMVCNLDVE